MKLHSVIVLLSLSLLQACSLFRADLVWPEGAYPREYFEAEYSSDVEAQQYQTRDNYLLWITRFYEGNALTPGWLGLTEQLLERLDESQHAEVSERMYQLGARIGREWAKDNEVRLLNTRNAAVWRDALRESAVRGDIHEYITQVENDVTAIMAGRLTHEDIFFERYYIDEFD